MQFYVLKPEEGIRFGTKWAYADQIDPVLRAEGRKCPVCDEPVGGMRWLPPHRIKLSSTNPKKWGDFLWGAGFDLMVSDRFKAIYRTEGLSGIEIFYPPAVIVHGSQNIVGDLCHELPTYHLSDISWNGANQDDIASNVMHERPEKIKCEFCRTGVSGRKQNAIILDEDSWTGADIFIPRGAPAAVIVSENFKMVAETYRLTNVWLIPSEEYGYDAHRPGLWYVRDM